ncbi:polysaccharide deacetylase family protein [Wenzhouxiangella sp. C33]|uniref:Polysaccharide deacetylase family protein n=2 Tax=Wenzhouxiangella limi TaxID=2707351 RepID=A0A845V9L0_9GAMM|nr:polysaccharide deacetylase family protein [Wenzhouxiangella limi]
MDRKRTMLPAALLPACRLRFQSSELTTCWMFADVRKVLSCLVLVSLWMGDLPPAVSGGTIALTFDDAPRAAGPLFSGEERTRRLIDTLDQARVTGAMFFVTTKHLSDVPGGTERLLAYVEAGHLLANHSHSHPWLWRTTAAEYIADIDQASSMLEGFDGVAPFFRYPYLDEGRSIAKRDEVRSALVQRGLRHGYVTVDNYDWYIEVLLAEAVAANPEIDETAWCDAYTSILLSGVAFYEDMARNILGRSPHHVLLLHENDIAALCVGYLIRGLRAKGWELVPAEKAFSDPIAAELPNTLFNGQGRVAALAHAAGEPAGALVHQSEDESWLRSHFTSLGLIPASLAVE